MLPGITLLSLPVLGQVRVDGQAYSMLYAWENATSNQQWDNYHGLKLRLRPENNNNLTVKANLRFARRGDPGEWDERIYNAYVDWSPKGRHVQARAGRQFMYRGVINGSVDALWLRTQPLRNLEVQAITGFRVPLDRSANVQSWVDGGVLGGFASFRFDRQSHFDVSYVQRQRSGKVAWRQLGSALNGAFPGGWYYQMRVDYNLEQSEVQTLRVRAYYNAGRWLLSGEYNNERPRVFEDSFFNLFELNGFDQFRGGVTYRLGLYRVGAQFTHTSFEASNHNDRIEVTAANRWGTLGLIYQNGFGGDNVGVFGDVRYDLVHNLTVQVRSSHYNFERRTISIDEDATSFSGGVIFRPVPSLALNAGIQQSLNTFYSHDFRALFKVNYRFRTQ